MPPSGSQPTGGKNPGGSTPKPPGKTQPTNSLPPEATSSPAAAIATLQAIFDRAGPKSTGTNYNLKKTGWEEGVELLKYLADVVKNTTPAASGSPLSLDQVRDCINESLSSFGEGLVTRLAPPLREPVGPGAGNAPVSYATVARRAMTAERPVAREISFSTASAGASDPIRQGSPRTIKGILDDAIGKSGIPELRGAVLGVRPNSKRTGFTLLAQTQQHADHLRTHMAAWTRYLPAGVELTRRFYSIEVHGVPIKYNPEGPLAREVFQGANSVAVPQPMHIAGLRWLHGPRTERMSKERSSMVVVLDDERCADTLIDGGASIEGAICEVTKHIPHAPQCFRCQQFFHIASACPTKTDPLTLRCARCAGNHKTAECECPHSPKCTDRRKCTHIKPRCANCDGAHKSFSNVCQVKSNAQKTVMARPEFAQPYFNPSFRSRAHAQSS